MNLAKNYNLYRVSAVQVENRIADIDYNINKIKEAIDDLIKKDVILAVFPELCISGYTIADLFFQKNIQIATENGLFEIAEYTKEKSITVVVGAALSFSGKLYNTAVIMSNGIIQGVVPKTYLVNNSEYYEERWFSSDNDRIFDYIEIGDNKYPFGSDLLFHLGKLSIGIEICEDLWAIKPPSEDLTLAGANVICNLSASNEYLFKSDIRTEKVLSHSHRLMGAYLYSSCGPSESSTDNVFSGHCLIAEAGELLAETEKFIFGNTYAIADIDVDVITTLRQKNNSYGGAKLEKNIRIIKIPIIDNINDCSNILPLRQYHQNPFLPFDGEEKAKYLMDIIELQKTALATRLRAIKCHSVVVGLSGGLDSTLALLIIIEAFKKINLDLNGILAVTLPGFGTTVRTKSNAVKLAEYLGITIKTISISEAVKQHFSDIEHDPNIYDITYENSQARERTQILMDLANKNGSIVIGTGDMSEMALGWCTYNADQMSMFNVNSGLTKTMVRDTVRFFAKELYKGEVAEILIDICNTPISPELLPPDEKGSIEQETEKSIGPYILHDFFLYYAMKNCFTPKKIVFVAQIAFEGLFTNEEIIIWLKVFYRRFFTQQFKRSAMPDGVKIAAFSLSPRGELRMPSDVSYNLWLKELEEL